MLKPALSNALHAPQQGPLTWMRVRTRASAVGSMTWSKLQITSRHTDLVEGEDEGERRALVGGQHDEEAVRHHGEVAQHEQELGRLNDRIHG